MIMKELAAPSSYHSLEKLQMLIDARLSEIPKQVFGKSSDIDNLLYSHLTIDDPKYSFIIGNDIYYKDDPQKYIDAVIRRILFFLDDKAKPTKNPILHKVYEILNRSRYYDNHKISTRMVQNLKDYLLQWLQCDKGKHAMYNAVDHKIQSLETFQIWIEKFMYTASLYKGALQKIHQDILPGLYTQYIKSNLYQRLKMIISTNYIQNKMIDKLDLSTIYLITTKHNKFYTFGKMFGVFLQDIINDYFAYKWFKDFLSDLDIIQTEITNGCIDLDDYIENLIYNFTKVIVFGYNHQAYRDRGKSYSRGKGNDKIMRLQAEYLHYTIVCKYIDYDKCGVFALGGKGITLDEKSLRKTTPLIANPTKRFADSDTHGLFVFQKELSDKMTRLGNLHYPINFNHEKQLHFNGNMFNLIQEFNYYHSDTPLVCLQINNILDNSSFDMINGWI